MITQRKSPNFKKIFETLGSQGSSGGEPSRPKRIKPIPPPLDLNARTLSPSDTLPQALPRSPADLPRECLPLRKRYKKNNISQLDVKKNTVWYCYFVDGVECLLRMILLTNGRNETIINFVYSVVQELVSSWSSRCSWSFKRSLTFKCSLGFMCSFRFMCSLSFKYDLEY